MILARIPLPGNVLPKNWTSENWENRLAWSPPLAITEIRPLRQLEDENRRLKRLVADLTLDKIILQEVLAKKS